MTEAMPFLQKAILLSYDPRPFQGCLLLSGKRTTTHQTAASPEVFLTFYQPMGQNLAC